MQYHSDENSSKNCLSATHRLRDQMGQRPNHKLRSNSFPEKLVSYYHTDVQYLQGFVFVLTLVLVTRCCKLNVMIAAEYYWL